jgi:hypothetical protein
VAPLVERRQAGVLVAAPAGLSAGIRTETVPVLGRVTCHRLICCTCAARSRTSPKPARRDADTYDGCCAPRLIELDPSRPISLHLGHRHRRGPLDHYRGIVGTMDPRVVGIFMRWGFRWGGDWRYPDPMHFELGTLTEPPG